jgi:hypothetical protein
VQGTELNAAWTLGSVAALTRRGVAGLCYYDLSGAGGLGDAGGLFPVGRLLSTLARLSGLPVLGCHLPAGVTGYAVRDRDRVRLFLACLDDEPVECDLRFPGRRVTRLVLQPWVVTEVCLESESAEHEGERDVDG